MARSRRQSRLSTSQTAAGLLTYALPTPVRHVASTRLGSKLIMVGVPAMVAAGLIHINFVDGTPKISIDRDRVAELHSAATEHLKNFDTDGRLQQWERTAQEYVRANPEQFSALYNPANERYSTGFPSTQRTATASPDSWRSGTDSPSTPYAPAGYAPSQNYASQNYASQNYASQNYTPQNYAPQTYPSPTYTPQSNANQSYTPQSYTNQSYASQNYATQNYPNQTYPGQSYPQATATTARQPSSWDYQQQQQYALQQQQIYDQQLRQQQQWQSQQPRYGATPQTVPAPSTQSFDPYRTR